MAVLSNADRRALWADFMRDHSARGERLALNKQQFRADVDAVDDWIEANKASFNAAIPLPGRTALTAKQKATLFKFVVDKRMEAV